MAGTKYFVSWYLHNKDNDGWAYKVVNKYDTLDVAQKQYHTELANYINSAAYDSVAVLLTDSNSNIIMREYWAPEPEPEE